MREIDFKGARVGAVWGADPRQLFPFRLFATRVEAAAVSIDTQRDC